MPNTYNIFSLYQHTRSFWILQQKKDAQGNYKFDCQHGELEYKENKLQACAINEMRKRPPFSLDNFIACYMSEKNKEQIAQKVSKRE